MERLSVRLRLAGQALATLEEILALEKSPVVRDAAIQRFEYTFEALWKAAQAYHRHVDGIGAASPKSVIRAAYQSGILTEEDSRAAMQMAEDRNLTVHTYNEELAELIYSRLPAYASLMRRWLTVMMERSAGAS